jgi:hypothetical protein
LGGGGGSFMVRFEIFWVAAFGRAFVGCGCFLGGQGDILALKNFEIAEKIMRFFSYTFVFLFIRYGRGISYIGALLGAY